jgi:hypothetical protein
MKTSPSEHKKKTEKVRKERITLFNKANNLGVKGANVYVIAEYNGKYFIYNSRSDKEWPPSEAILVSDIIFALFVVKGHCRIKERYYPIPERSTPNDICRRIDRIKERSRAKQTRWKVTLGT